VSRVLLFVQTGDGRPKCFSSHGVNRSLYTDGWRLSESALTAQGAADRWWLVECENAEAGREVIASGFGWLRTAPAREGPRGPVETGPIRTSRILASGWKS